MVKRIQVTGSSMPSFEEYTKEIEDLWESRWLTNMGEKHQKLENDLLNYLDTPNISLFTNGHLALESAIKCFNLQGEVITTPFTFASTTHAITRNGLTPVFCDINMNDYTMQVEDIESLITKKTTAILPVHVYGNICNIEKINEIAEKYNLKVIYDAAHAFGVTINGESIANFGDASMFSFHATKVFNTIEGGALTFKDAKMYEIFKTYKNFGITGQETVDYIGTNAKMNEFQAAMGICNLRHVDEEIAKRKIVYQRYIEHLYDIKGIKVTIPKENIKSNYAYFPIIIENYKYTRDEIYEKLKNSYIFARKYFYPLINDFKCYSNQYDSTHTPNAKYIAERALTLPLYADLSLDDVDRICTIIKE